jgi:predicted dehydrogenase
VRCPPRWHCGPGFAPERWAKLLGGQLTFCHPGLLDGWFDGKHRWLLDPARAGGGALLDLGLHLVDLLHWLAPERELTARGASLQTRADPRGRGRRPRRAGLGRCAGQHAHQLVQLDEARRAGKAIHALLSGVWPAAS